MTKEEIIGGLQFTIGMFLLNPNTGEKREEYELNDMDKTTIEACKGAIELLEQEPKTDGDCIREKDEEAIEKKLRLAGYEKVVTCAECVHGVEVGPGLYKCLDCDWIGDDDFWCKEGKRREE